MDEIEAAHARSKKLCKATSNTPNAISKAIPAIRDAALKRNGLPMPEPSRGTPQ
jgi:hypothetical protein